MNDIKTPAPSSAEHWSRYFNPRHWADWVLAKAAHPKALWWLAFFSFIEGFAFPVPPDVMVVPMVLADRKRAWIIASIATVATTCGGIVGYFIGFGFYATVGQDLVAFLGIESGVTNSINLFNEWGPEIIMVGALSPIPYKAIAIASGLTSLNLVSFIMFSLLGRAMRFFIEVAIIYRFHRLIKLGIERYLGLISTAVLCVVLLGFLALRYIN